jgi:hypothetical protein
MQLPRKKRGKRILSGPKTPNDKVGKGLRHFSMKVCEKVQQKGITSYNEVSDFMRLFHVFHIFLHTSFRMSSFLCSYMYKASLKISGRSRTLSGNGHYPVTDIIRYEKVIVRHNWFIAGQFVRQHINTTIGETVYNWH